MFGHHGVDSGTRFLLRRAPSPPPGGDLLDLGCGYGPIAVTLGLRAPAARIWAVDVNRRALELTAANAAAAGATNVIAAITRGGAQQSAVRCGVQQPAGAHRAGRCSIHC